jgi:hypothetical protein
LHSLVSRRKIKVATPELLAHWDSVRTLLRNALSELNKSPSAPLAVIDVTEFENFMEHNELELALYSLVQAGELVTPRAKFWSGLHQAAVLMELRETGTELLLKFAEAASRSLDQAMQTKTRSHGREI